MSCVCLEALFRWHFPSHDLCLMGAFQNQLQKQSELLLNADDLDAMWVCLRENCVIDDATGAEKVKLFSDAHICTPHPLGKCQLLHCCMCDIHLCFFIAVYEALLCYHLAYFFWNTADELWRFLPYCHSLHGADWSEMQTFLQPFKLHEVWEGWFWEDCHPTILSLCYAYGKLFPKGKNQLKLSASFVPCAPFCSLNLIDLWVTGLIETHIISVSVIYSDLKFLGQSVILLHYL